MGHHPLQTAWIEMQVPQCGYCQSGQIMQAAVLLKDYPDPTDEDINAVMAGNLCRCMTYVRIRKRHQTRSVANARRVPCLAFAHAMHVRSAGSRAFAAQLSDRDGRNGHCAGIRTLSLAAVEFPFRAAEHATAHGNLFEPTIWYSASIATAWMTVNIIRAEMGQHVGTALARIVADELEADWDKVRSYTSIPIRNGA